MQFWLVMSHVFEIFHVHTELISYFHVVILRHILLTKINISHHLLLNQPPFCRHKKGSVFLSKVFTFSPVNQHQ
jgi:hypothetical protein